MDIIECKELWSSESIELWRVDRDYGKPSFHIFIDNDQVLFTFDPNVIVPFIKIARLILGE